MNNWDQNIVTIILWRVGHWSRPSSFMLTLLCLTAVLTLRLKHKLEDNLELSQSNNHRQHRILQEECVPLQALKIRAWERFNGLKFIFQTNVPSSNQNFFTEKVPSGNIFFNFECFIQTNLNSTATEMLIKNIFKLVWSLAWVVLKKPLFSRHFPGKKQCISISKNQHMLKCLLLRNLKEL